MSDIKTETNPKVTDYAGNNWRLNQVYQFRNWYVHKNIKLVRDIALNIDIPESFTRPAIIGFEKQMNCIDGITIFKSIPIMGHTSRISNPVMYYQGSYYQLEVSDEKMLNEHNVKEHIIDGIFYFKEDMKHYKKPHKRKPYNTFSNTYTSCELGFSHTQVHYGFILEEYQNAYNKTKSITHLLTNGLNYSFGVEIEFAKGFIPEHIQFKINAFCERDGSLNPHLKTHPDATGPNDNPGGGEIVTNKLCGDQDIKHLQYICYELSKRCKVDKYCGVHAHIGNIPTDKAFIIRLYKLGMLIQDELFATLPASRAQNDYCKKLPDLGFYDYAIESKEDYEIINSLNYEKIFIKFTNNEVKPSREWNSRNNHPKGSKAGYNHNNLRYCWLNLLPLIFNTRTSKFVKSTKKKNKIESKTAEFRCLNGTLNFWKIYYYLLLYFAIIHYATNKDISLKVPVTLNEILSYTYGRKSINIIQFFNERKVLFKGDVNKQVERTEYTKEKVVNPVNTTLKQLIKF